MLAVVTCFYNFANFNRPKANLLRFLRQMRRDGVDVFGVEAFAGRENMTRGFQGWKQVPINPATQMLWQKEAAINLAAKNLDKKYTAVAWVDADVWFQNPNWVKDTLEALKTQDVVQMFANCHWTRPDGTIEMSRPSVGKTRLNQDWKSHPGFAWAMKRELWDKAGGLYPYALSGGGDTIMTLAFQNSPMWPHALKHLGAVRAPFEQWAAHFKGAKLGFVQGQLFHEWHGTRKDRDYVGRCERVSCVDVTQHLRLASNGLLEWTSTADPNLVRAVKDYFIQKNDDSQ